MNPSVTLPFAQMFLSWMLLGVLLAWMLLFAILAFRPQKNERREAADLPTPSGAFPIIVARTPLSLSASPVEVALGNVSVTSNEQSDDIGAAPVA
ncbi:MAG TPA: hypothetical protein VFN35_09055 [Ktedonobacteraceae bacterium]|nr:hypothetical protein [Ktedonobacteraceae bacterium]